jgi:hypothetical protein
MESMIFETGEHYQPENGHIKNKTHEPLEFDDTENIVFLPASTSTNTTNSSTTDNEFWSSLLRLALTTVQNSFVL